MTTVGGVGVERWQRVSEWPLTVAALAFLGAYAWPILQPSLPADWVRACQLVSWGTWAVFAVDYAVRLLLTGGDRRAFIRRNVVDLLIIALPLLRPLRLLRLVLLLQVLNRFAGASFRGRVAVYVGGSTLLILFVASLAVLNAERTAPGANIQDFGDAVWWALTTVTTVGYGDRYPTTSGGRVVAVGLMITGIALLGVVTASLASWLIERVQEVEEESQAASRRDVQALRLEVLALRELLQGQMVGGANPHAGPLAGPQHPATDPHGETPRDVNGGPTSGRPDRTASS